MNLWLLTVLLDSDDSNFLAGWEHSDSEAIVVSHLLKLALKAESEGKYISFVKIYQKIFTYLIRHMKEEI